MPDPNITPDPSQEPWTTALKVAPGVSLALLGAAVRILRSSEPFSFKSYIAGLTTAAFTGLLVAYYLEWANVNPQLRIVIVGASGYMARDVLDFVTKYGRQWFSRQLDTKSGPQKIPEEPPKKHPSDSGISLTLTIDPDAGPEAKRAAAKAVAKVLVDDAASDIVPPEENPASAANQAHRIPRRLKTPRPE